MVRQPTSNFYSFVFAILLVGLIGSAPVLNRWIDSIGVAFAEQEAESLEIESESDLHPIDLLITSSVSIEPPDMFVLERLSYGDLSTVACSNWIIRLRGPPR
jgi:hypothetical protein